MGTGSSTMETAVLEEIIFRKNQKLLYVFDFFNDRSLFVEYTGELKEIEDREYPICTNSKGIPPKQVVFGTSSRKLYNNIVVSDDDDDEDEVEPEVDDLFLNGENEETLPDFENPETLSEEDE
jgi:hypothetical protein